MDRDNQQANPNYEIGWLVGIIDGEGWVILGKALNYPSKRYRYIPTVGINSTSPLIIGECHRILDKYNVGHWIQQSKIRNVKWKDQWVCVIRGYKRIKQILPIIKDRLIAKSQQANILYDFIQYREKLNNWDIYGEIEDNFYQEIKRLNRKGKPQRLKVEHG